MLTVGDMGGGWFPKFLLPKQNMINQQIKVGEANSNKRAKCWCGTGKVGVATATPAIRHSPPMVGDLTGVDACMMHGWSSVPEASCRYSGVRLIEW